VVDQNPLAGNEFIDGGAIQATTTDAGNSLVSTSAAAHQSKFHNTAASGTFAGTAAAFKVLAASSVRKRVLVTSE
jgi:hypothetical protein